MPKVPEYDSLSVGAETLKPVVLNPYDVPDDAVAGAEARVLGKGLLEMGKGLTKVALEQKKLDEDSMLNKATADMLQRGLDWQMQNNNRLGTEAFGMTDQYVSHMRTGVDEVALNLPEHLRQAWVDGQRKSTLTSASTVSSYEGGQIAKVREQNEHALISGWAERMTLATGPTDFDHAESQLRQAIEQKVKRMGMDPVAADKFRADTFSDVYVARVKKRLRDDPRGAMPYYEGVRSQITDPKVRTELDGDVKNAYENAEAEVFIEQNFDSLTREAVMGKYEGDQQTHALGIYDQMKASRANDLENTRRTVSGEMWDALQEHGDITKLDSEKMRWLQKNDPSSYKALYDAVSGKNIETDEAVYGVLSQMRLEMPDEFQKLDLNQYRMALSNGDFRSMLESQRTVSSENSNMKESEQIKTIFNLFGMNGKDEEKSRGKFMRAYDISVQDFKATHNGRLPTQEERQAILDGLMIEGDSSKDGTGSMFSWNKYRYQVVGTEDAEKWNPIIPGEVRREIAAELKKQGKIASDQNILQTYKIMMGM